MTSYATTRRTKPVAAAVSWKALDTINPLQQGLHLDHAQPWQWWAWDAYHNVGEIQFPFSQLARTASQVDWTVTVGEETLSEREFERISAQIHRGIGENEATRRLILNLLIAGDATYIKLDTGMQVLSVIDPNARTLIGKAADWWRIHVPDPTNPDYGDSSVRSVLGPVSDLRWLERLSRANSRSRAATAGILITPVNEKMDEFYDTLNEALQTGMQTPDGDYALPPVHIQIPDKMDRPAMLHLAPELDRQIHERINSTQRRIAVGIAAPAELITGNENISHWGLWAIQEDVWRSHLASPMQIVGDLYAAVHEKLENLPVGKVTWTPDPARLFARKSTVTDALSAHSQHAVSGKYLREVLGAGEEAKPGPDDFEVWALETPALGESELALETGPPRTGREAGLAASYAIYATRNRLGHQVRSKLGSAAPQVPNGDLIATVGLEAAAKHIDLDAEIRRSLSAFGAWWDIEVGGPAPNLAGFIAATIAKPAAELQPLDLDGLSDTLALRSQQTFDALLGAVEEGKATKAWWTKEMRAYVADLEKYGLGGDDWTPSIEASAALLEQLVATRKLAAKDANSPTMEASEIARLVCARAGGG